MRIVYHHRTRSTDAQRIHIQEIVRAFQELGHEVEIVSLVPLDTAQDNPERDAGDALWKKLAREIPFAYEIAQLGYNLVGIPMLLFRTMRAKADFLYERYALFNFAGALTAKLCRVPLVLEVNSPFALEQARDGEIRGVRFAAWTERLICNMATRVIVVSTPLARLMQAAGVDGGKLEVMPNGVSLEDFRPGSASAELRRRLGIADHVVAGFVGWFRNWHGLELLLEAGALLRASGRKLKLLLIGDGPAMGALQKLAAGRGLLDMVVFTGPLPHSRVPAYLDVIDIAVQPAANEYCCPMKILEYMALGKPIVAPRQENVIELLRDGEEARLFSTGSAEALAEAIAVLADDSAGRRQMGDNAQRAILKRGYLWKNNAQRVIDMALASRRKPSGGKTVAAGA